MGALVRPGDQLQAYGPLRATQRFWVPLQSDRVIDHVEPAQNAVEDHPENRMVEAP